MLKIIASMMTAAIAIVCGSQAMSADYLAGDFQKSRGYSTAVATEGGRTIWMAGEGGVKDTKGNDISNNTPAQIEYIFGQFAETLKTYGGTTDDIVKMTVFIKDQADGTPFTQMRKKFFPRGNYPASSLITIKDLAWPGMMIEIEAFAVIKDACTQGSCSAKPSP
jgi:2-iminobutanoate/2-iminopropanoate deaminase